MLLCNLSA